MRALPYAALAAIFFWLDDDNFYTHSLWHMYVFIAVGFGILFITDMKDSKVMKDSKDMKVSKGSRN